MYWFDGVPAQKVGILFGLSEASVHRLLTGETYRWADGPRGEADARKYVPPRPEKESAVTQRLRRRMFTDERTLQLRPPYRVVNTVVFETWEDLNGNHGEAGPGDGSS